LGLSLRASDYADSRSYGAFLSAATPAKPIGKSKFAYSTGLKLNYSLATGLSIDYSEEDDALVVTTSDELQPMMTESLSLRLHCPEWKAGDKTSITSGLTLSSSWHGGQSRQSLSANAGFSYKLPDNGNLRLYYSASLGCREARFSDFTHRQLLNLNVNYAKPGVLESIGLASYDVESSRFTGSASLSYFPSFQRTAEGNPQWVLNVSGFHSKWQGSNTSDLKVGLTRGIGNWQVSLNYSPHGSEFASGFLSGTTSLSGTSGYGFVQELGRTFWVEIGARSF